MTAAEEATLAPAAPLVPHCISVPQHLCITRAPSPTWLLPPRPSATTCPPLALILEGPFLLNQEVQQLCEALEQQIQEERQRMEQESTARSRLHCAVLQRALDARDREVQRLVAAQEELEAQCRSLSSTQRAASAENRQLEENNRALEEQLQHIHAQLQQTHECLRAARAQQRAEEPRDGVEAELPGETPPSLQVLQVCTVGMLGCHAEQHRAAWVLGKG